MQCSVAVYYYVPVEANRYHFGGHQPLAFTFDQEIVPSIRVALDIRKVLFESRHEDRFRSGATASSVGAKRLPIMMQLIRLYI